MKQAIPCDCHKCGHSWITQSKYVKVSCPSCGAKVKNPIAVLKVKEALERSA